nr:MAG TPA: hypothetical protein [Caudoviricetes sp.]
MVQFCKINVKVFYLLNINIDFRKEERKLK